MEWLPRESNPEASLLHNDPVLAKFLSARGFRNSSEAQNFLNFSLKSLKDPLSLKGMAESLQRLTQARELQEAICVYGDFDMDGTPAIALMVRSLRALGYQNVYYCQPDRHKDGYGFHYHLAEPFILEKKVKVFITVDVGITDWQTTEKIQAQGLDVILTDHHQVQEIRPSAFSIINPNQPECESGLGYLCGTGVAFYLIMGLRRQLKDKGLLEKYFDIKSILDCFAIATIADLVPLQNENRILVKHGLKVLEKTSMVGIRLLLQALKLSDKTLSSQDVAIRFVPKLNSLTRLDVELKPIDLFLVEDAEKAALMVQTLLKNNERRVFLLDEAETLMESMVAQAKDSHVLFFWSENFHKGLVGLLASKLVNNYNKPAFVGSLTKDDVIVGSARTPNADVNNVFAALQNTQEHLNKFGGHPAAAGFELSPEKSEAFYSALQDYFSSAQTVEKKQIYDFIADFKQIKNLMNHWDELEPFGQAFLPPLIAIQSLKVQKVNVLKKIHFKVQFQDPFGFMMEVMWFSPDSLDYFSSADPEQLFDILCEPQWNEFMGTRRVQLLLKDIRFAE